MERILVFFEANQTEEDSKKRAILLLNVGTETYKVIKSLAMPKKPAGKSFKKTGFTKRAPNT